MSNSLIKPTLWHAPDFALADTDSVTFIHVWNASSKPVTFIVLYIIIFPVENAKENLEESDESYELGEVHSVAEEPLLKEVCKRIVFYLKVHHRLSLHVY